VPRRGVECAPAPVAVKVVRPVGRCTLTAPARRRGLLATGSAWVLAEAVCRVASVVRVREVADPKSRAIRQTVERFGRLDILVNNAGLVLLGPVVGADPDEWDRMIAINTQGLLYTAHAALPYLLKAAEDDPRQVRSPDIVNISSIAGRVAWNGYGVYNMTNFGVNGFTEAPCAGKIGEITRPGSGEPAAP